VKIYIDINDIGKKSTEFQPYDQYKSQIASEKKSVVENSTPKIAEN